MPGVGQNTAMNASLIASNFAYLVSAFPFHIPFFFFFQNLLHHQCASGTCKSLFDTQDRSKLCSEFQVMRDAFEQSGTYALSNMQNRVQP